MKCTLFVRVTNKTLWMWLVVDSLYKNAARPDVTETTTDDTKTHIKNDKSHTHTRLLGPAAEQCCYAAIIKNTNVRRSTSSMRSECECDVNWSWIVMSSSSLTFLRFSVTFLIIWGEIEANESDVDSLNRNCICLCAMFTVKFYCIIFFNPFIFLYIYLYIYYILNSSVHII